MVYFIQEGNSGPIKIGQTFGSPLDRLTQLQTGNPRELHLLGVMHGHCGDEEEIHRQFAGVHLRGEWFQPTQELLAFISDNCLSRQQFDKAWSNLQAKGYKSNHFLWQAWDCGYIRICGEHREYEYGASDSKVAEGGT